MVVIDCALLSDRAPRWQSLIKSRRNLPARKPHPIYAVRAGLRPDSNQNADDEPAGMMGGSFCGTDFNR